MGIEWFSYSFSSTSQTLTAIGSRSIWSLIYQLNSDRKVEKPTFGAKFHLHCGSSRSGMTRPLFRKRLQFRKHPGKMTEIIKRKRSQFPRSEMLKPDKITDSSILTLLENNHWSSREQKYHSSSGLVRTG